MRKNRLQAALVCCFATAWLQGNAAFAADGKVLDLKRISEGKGAKAAPGAAIRWDANVKGKAALFARSVVWLEELNFSDGTIECDILGKSAPRPCPPCSMQLNLNRLVAYHMVRNSAS